VRHPCSNKCLRLPLIGKRLRISGRVHESYRHQSRFACNNGRNRNGKVVIVVDYPLSHPRQNLKRQEQQTRIQNDIHNMVPMNNNALDSDIRVYTTDLSCRTLLCLGTYYFYRLRPSSLLVHHDGTASVAMMMVLCQQVDQARKMVRSFSKQTMH
jgi:hypothetical protein